MTVAASLADSRLRRSVHRVSRRPPESRSGPDWPSRPCRVADYAWQRNTPPGGLVGADVDGRADRAPVAAGESPSGSSFICKLFFACHVTGCVSVQDSLLSPVRGWRIALSVVPKSAGRPNTHAEGWAPSPCTYRPFKISGLCRRRRMHPAHAPPWPAARSAPAPSRPEPAAAGAGP